MLGSLFNLLYECIYTVICWLYIPELIKFVDIYYAGFLWWLWYPTLLSILLPLVLVATVYLTALFFALYGLKHGAGDTYTSPLWFKARKIAAWYWSAHGRVWNGFELHGMEHVPSTGPALIVAYHATVPIDIYYFIAECIRSRDRTPSIVGDRFLFRVPGWQQLMKVLGVTPGTVSECCASLKEGKLLVILPGGVREALFGGSNYEMLWGSRKGFARVAKLSKVPVIPVFTENGREAFRIVEWGKRLWMQLYEKTRLPLAPVYGNFPVKLRMYFGEPMTFGEASSVEEIADQIQTAVTSMINKHQNRKPGSVLRALLDRFLP